MTAVREHFERMAGFYAVMGGCYGGILLVILVGWLVSLVTG